MSNYIQVGYVCDKSKGHAVLYGMEDACQSHAVAPIVIVDPGDPNINMQDVAEDMAQWLAALERDAEKWRWHLVDQRREKQWQ